MDIWDATSDQKSDTSSNDPTREREQVALRWERGKEAALWLRALHQVIHRVMMKFRNAVMFYCRCFVDFSEYTCVGFSMFYF